MYCVVKEKHLASENTVANNKLEHGNINFLPLVLWQRRVVFVSCECLGSPVWCDDGLPCTDRKDDLGSDLSEIERERESVCE